MYKKSKSCQIPTLANIYEETFGYKTDGWFVDAGAYDCQQWSNTYELARLGWHGLFIEPQPEMVKGCHKNLDRLPNVIVVGQAVSNFSGTTAMRLAGSLSTMSQDMIDDYRSSEGFKTFFDGDGEWIDVKVSTLDQLLELYNVPVGFDLLSIDVEGSELAALQGFDVARWRPKLVIVETYAKSHEKSLQSRSLAIDAYFDEASYEVVYADHINSIYKKES